MNQEQATAQAEKIFNSAADYFDDPVMSFWNRFGQRTVEHLQLQPGDKVLDVCCGTGASAIQVGVTGSVLGADLAESLLVLARHKSRQL